MTKRPPPDDSIDIFRTSRGSLHLTRQMETTSGFGAFKSSVAVPAGAALGHGLLERWRKRISLVAVPAIALAAYLSPVTEHATARAAETYGGLALVIVAVLGRLWCALYIAGRKNAELCTVGPYSLVRHPLYVFSSLGVLGVLLALHRLPVAVAGFAAFWAYYHWVMREEEARLARNFGADFEVYRRRVAGVWPRFDRFHDVPNLAVTMRPLRRAFTEVAWFFVAWIVASLASG